MKMEVDFFAEKVFSGALLNVVEAKIFQGEISVSLLRELETHLQAVMAFCSPSLVAEIKTKLKKLAIEITPQIRRELAKEELARSSH